MAKVQSFASKPEIVRLAIEEGDTSTLQELQRRSVLARLRNKHLAQLRAAAQTQREAAAAQAEAERWRIFCCRAWQQARSHALDNLDGCDEGYNPFDHLPPRNV